IFEKSSAEEGNLSMSSHGSAYRIERAVLALSDDITKSSAEIIVAMRAEISTAYTPGGNIVTAQLDQHLRELNKSQYIEGFDRLGESQRLLASVGSTGDFGSASSATKCRAYAWAVRALA